MLSGSQDGQDTKATKKQRDRNGRKNAATACDVCRRRRIRCLPADEPGQPCKGCAAGSVECIFSGSDKRKESMQELRAKLSQFESLFSGLSGVAESSSSAAQQQQHQLPTLPDPAREPQSMPLPEAPLRSSSYDIHVEQGQPSAKRRRLSGSANQETSNPGPSPVQNFFASPSGSGSVNLQSGGSPASLLRPSLPPQAGSNGPGVPVVMDRLTLEAGEIRAYGRL